MRGAFVLSVLIHGADGLRVPHVVIDPWTNSLLGLPRPASTRSHVADARTAAAAAHSNGEHLLLSVHSTHLPQHGEPEHREPAALGSPHQQQHAAAPHHEQQHHAAVASEQRAPSAEPSPEPSPEPCPEPSLKPDDEIDAAKDLPCVSAGLETLPELGSLPRFYVVARPVTIDEPSVQIVLRSLRLVLDQDMPFSVVWDLRQIKVPPRAVIRIATDWMGLPDNAAPLDKNVRATAVIVKGPIIRAVASWTVKICNPPSPVKICRNQDEALEFARPFGCDP